MTDNSNNIIILTGKTECGKTAALCSLLKGKTDITEIITFAKKGKKILFNPAGGGKIFFRVDESFQRPIRQIGRYAFDDEAFKRGEKIVESSNLSQINLFVLDEACPLELNGMGFYKAIKTLLFIGEKYKMNIHFAVRELFGAYFIRLLGVRNPLIIRKEGLIKY